MDNLTITMYQFGASASEGGTRPLSEIEASTINREAWQKVVETRGTHAIFSRRARRLRLTRVTKDFLGIFVPSAVGLIVASAWFAPEYLKYITALSLVLALPQLALSILSLAGKWDDRERKAIISMQENNKLSREWERMAKSEAPEQLTFLELHEKTVRQEEFDLEQVVSDKEMRFGMRHALHNLGKACATCGNVPKDMKATNCGTCGNF